jgi:hypothetical protein
MAKRLGDENARRAGWSREWHEHDLHRHPVPSRDRADGTLCGYGGGLWRKKWLLDHEATVQSVTRGRESKPMSPPL